MKKTITLLTIIASLFSIDIEGQQKNIDGSLLNCTYSIWYYNGINFLADARKVEKLYCLTEDNRKSITNIITKYRNWSIIATNTTLEVSKLIDVIKLKVCLFKYSTLSKYDTAPIMYFRFEIAEREKTDPINPILKITMPEVKAYDNEYMTGSEHYILLDNKNVNILYDYLTTGYIEDKKQMDKKLEDEKKAKDMFK